MNLIDEINDENYIDRFPKFSIKFWNRRLVVEDYIIIKKSNEFLIDDYIRD